MPTSEQNIPYANGIRVVVRRAGETVLSAEVIKEDKTIALFNGKDGHTWAAIYFRGYQQALDDTEQKPEGTIAYACGYQKAMEDVGEALENAKELYRSLIK